MKKHPLPKEIEDLIHVVRTYAPERMEELDGLSAKWRKGDGLVDAQSVLRRIIYNYLPGMTVNERKDAMGLMTQWDYCVKERDASGMREILRQLRVPEKDIDANLHNYGLK